MGHADPASNARRGLPRPSTGYFALRNRPSILIETHSRKPFRTRVLGNHAWLGALVEQVAKDPDALVEAVATAERWGLETRRLPAGTALRDPAFAADSDARAEWWARQTPYWDETTGLVPVYRVLRPLPPT